jgi:hypothetical protein
MMKMKIALLPIAVLSMMLVACVDAERSSTTTQAICNSPTACPGLIEEAGGASVDEVTSMGADSAELAECSTFVLVETRTGQNSCGVSGNVPGLGMRMFYCTVDWHQSSGGVWSIVGISCNLERERAAPTLVDSSRQPTAVISTDACMLDPVTGQCARNLETVTTEYATATFPDEMATYDISFSCTSVHCDLFLTNGPQGPNATGIYIICFINGSIRCGWVACEGQGCGPIL